MSAHKGGCLGCHSDAEPVECGKASITAFVGAIVVIAIDPKQAGLYLGSLCPAHSQWAVLALVEHSRANGLPIADLQARLNRLLGIERRADA